MKNLLFFLACGLVFLFGCQGVVEVAVEPLPPTSGVPNPCGLQVGEAFVLDFYQQDRIENGMPQAWGVVAVSSCDYGQVTAWVGRWGSSDWLDFDSFWFYRGQNWVVVGLQETLEGELRVTGYYYW